MSQLRDIFKAHKFYFAAQKMKVSIESFLSKYDEICSFLRIWSHLLKQFCMKNFIFMQCFLFLLFEMI